MFNDVMVAVKRSREEEHINQFVENSRSSRFLAQKSMQRRIKRSMLKSFESEDPKLWGVAEIQSLCVVDSPEGVIANLVGEDETLQVQEIQEDHLLREVDRIAWQEAKKLGLLVYAEANYHTGLVSLFAKVIDRDDPKEMGKVGEGHTGLR